MTSNYYSLYDIIIVNINKLSYHWAMKSSNSGENFPAGNFGGGSLTTCLSCSKGVGEAAYGNFPEANSICKHRQM